MGLFYGSVSRRCRLHFAVGSGTTSLKGGTAHYKFDAKIRVMPVPAAVMEQNEGAAFVDSTKCGWCWKIMM